MRKILIAILLFAGLAAKSQTWTLVNGRWEYVFFKVDSVLTPPQDTLASAAVGSLAIKGSTAYVKGTPYWIAVTGSGGNGVWGFVTGNIHTQADLQTEFGTKYDTTVRKVDTVYTITDSTYGMYINGRFTSFKARGSIPSFNRRGGAITLTMADVDTALGYAPSNLPNVANLLQVVNGGGAVSLTTGLYASRPAAGSYGRFYVSTDSLKLQFDNGTSWITIGGGPGGGGGSGTITLINTGYGISGGPITSSGTIIVDSATLALYFVRRADSNTTFVTPLQLSAKESSIAASNTVNQYWNGFKHFVGLNTDSIFEGTTHKFNKLPAGGTTGQVATKNSNTDYDVSWQTPSTSSGNPNTYKANGQPGDTSYVSGNGSGNQIKVAAQRDSLDYHSIINADSSRTHYVQAHDTTSGNALQSKYRSDTSRNNLYAGLSSKKNVNDSAATNPAAFTTQASRQKAIDSLISLINKLLPYYDTAAGTPGSYITWPSRQKLADSLANLVLLRRLISDTSGINSTATRGWLYKVADSLAALISGGGGCVSCVTNSGGANILGVGTYATMPTAATGSGLYYATDSSRFYYSNGTAWSGIVSNLYFHNSGRRGDSLATTSGGNTVVFPKFIDSVGMCLHHIINADSTWTWYVDSTCMVTWPHLGKVRDSLLAIIAGKQASGSYVTNAGNAPSIQTGILSSRPSASSCANCFYGSTTDSTWYFSDGTAWSPMGKGSAGAGGGTPAGSTHSVQSNGGSGVFEATPNFVTNPTTHTVSADTLSTLKLQADSIRLVNFPLFINGVTTATMVGDSYLACVRPDGPDTCITTRIAAGYSILENNIAVGGTGLARMDSVFYHSVNPGTGSAATLATNGAALITLGALNDFRRGGYAPKTLGKVLNGYNALFVNQFMKKFVAGGATDSHLTRYGSFATGYQGTTVYGKTSNGALSNTLNDSLVYTDTVGAAGGALFWGTIVSDSGVNKYSESVLAYVDNTLVGTYNLSHNQTDGISDGTYDNERTPAAFMYIVSPGVHHLKIINNTAHSLYVPVDMVGTLLDTASAKAIPWVLFEIPHLAEGGYLLSPSLGSDLVMNLANASLDSLRATWPAGYPTVMVKTNNYFKSWSSDSIHPNNTGDAQLFQAFSAAVTTANAGPYHILNIAGNPYWVNGSGVALPLATSASNAFIQNQTGGVQAATYNISGGAAAASMTTAATNQGAGIPLTGKAFQAGTLPGGNTFASWYTSSAPTDQKTSAWYSTTSAFNLGFWNDAGTLNTNVISIGKIGYGSGGVNFGVPVYLGTASGNGLQGLLSPNTALISFTGTVTGGLAEPFIVNANAVSGLTMQLINSNAGSGASSSLLIKSTGTGQISSPTIDWNAAGTDFFAGQDASTNTFKINTGAPAGNGFGAGTNLLTFLGNGKLGLGGITNPWALLSLPGATTSAASLNIPAGNQPTTAHPGDFYRDTTTGNLWMYLAGAWSQISNQTSGASGVVHVGTLDSVTANAKGGSIVGASYYNQSATASFPGLVNITSQSFAGLKTFTNGLSALTIQTGATYCVALGTSFVAGSGAGTSPTVTTSLTDMGGQITITTGSTPSANAALITITYQNEYPNASFPTLTAGNAAAAALTGPNQVYPGTVTQAAFTINTGSIALAGSTTYTWYYHVTGY